MIINISFIREIHPTIQVDARYLGVENILSHSHPIRRHKIVDSHFIIRINAHQVPILETQLNLEAFDLLARRMITPESLRHRD
jgi:hypothetical protein